ncbi:MAG: DNA methyltransferase [Chloroflexaceae bacterium]|nr:DNA methyltransferase [Chloroflexaceae bacterium]
MVAGRKHTHPGPTSTLAALADDLARMAHEVRGVVLEILRDDGAGGTLREPFERWRGTLRGGEGAEGASGAMGSAGRADEDGADFADGYAQTVVYSLFAARAANPNAARFTRFDAAGLVSGLPPFLRGLFDGLISPHLDVRLARLLDACALVLEHADLAAVIPDADWAEPPAVTTLHFTFYDWFLAAYCPGLRGRRGVYSTPAPVVSYLVRSVDWVLRTQFDGRAGLASEGVMVLDPATGTAPFLCAVVRHVCETLMAMGMGGDRLGQRDGADRLLPQLSGFEVLPTPYVAAHLNLGLLRHQCGVTLGSHAPWNLFLVNALADEAAVRQVLSAAGAFAGAGTEAGGAGGGPVLVVMGNPPYSYQSANGCQGSWIGRLVRDYYAVDGRPLGERNPKGLQDDYVKFFRLAQWLIHQVGAGILAYVCNHSYLDNPTFRGMRWSLLQTFDLIFILNLHGHCMKKEHAPGGLPDENVFDIQQGVAIGLFVKRPERSERSEPSGHSEASQAVVRYADLWGSRDAKFAALREQDVRTTAWQTLTPSAPWYLLVPHDTSRRAEYEQGWKVTEVFPVHGVGLMTGRDALTVWGSDEEVWRMVGAFAAASVEEARAAYALGKDTQEWQVARAQRDVLASGPHPSGLTRLLYRPFDVRYTYYTGRPGGFHSRPRTRVMRHMRHRANLGLVTVRQVAEGSFSHVFVTDTLVECRVMLSNKGYGYLFPLYLYPSPPGPERRPNLSPAFVRDLEERLGLGFVPDGKGDLRTTVGPEDIFHFLYAVLHRAAYRERYAAFLAIDFPRVPLTSNRALFASLAEVGAALVDLHLLRVGGGSGAALWPGPVGPEGEAYRVGDGPIEMVRYDERQGRVLVGRERYVAGVEPETWAMQVGGYQPLAKWLKDRRGQTLGSSEVAHYLRMVVALRETRRLVGEIEALVGAWPMA